MMALVTGYSSSSDDDDNDDGASGRLLKAGGLALAKVIAAPKIKSTSDELTLIETDKHLTKFNGAGVIESEFIDDQMFKLQQRYSENDKTHNANLKETNSRDGANNSVRELRSTKTEARAIKKRRLHKGDITSVEGDDAYLGPWAKYKESSEDENDELSQESENDQEDEPTVTSSSDSEDIEESKGFTEFLGSSELDYQGRTYMHVPNDVGVNLKSDEEPKECFVPKRQIHKWKGHKNGTNKIEFLPNSNHLLLSCGNDSNVYLWSVYHKREQLRGYYGHTKPVKDINFDSDGKRFLSTGYDKTVKLWDTETGECLSSFTLKSVANVVKFNPFDKNEFLVGLINHKIEHYDITEHKLVQTYDHHLGSINSLTFFSNKRFISTSEDKTARVWDIHVNIPIKQISDPTLHSMPVTKVHPEENYFAAQSMDNTIMVFQAKNKYKTNRKKIFSGHNCAGYGIGIDFSPDGKIIVSGDSAGNAIFWDWKTTKVIKKLKIDEKAITQVLWNSKEVSKVAFTGSSGAIYYYD